LLPSGSPFGGLLLGDGDADVNFSGKIQVGEGGIVSLAEIEGDDVGGAGVIEKFLVQVRHNARGDEVNGQFVIGKLQQILQERCADVAQDRLVKGASALPVAKREVLVL